MSWLFGLNKGQNIEAPQVPTFEEGGGDVGPPAGGQPSGSGGGAPLGDGGGNVGSGSEGYRSEAYSFDSTALERAAKAAKVSEKCSERILEAKDLWINFFQDLERSKYANQALDLSKLQEDTKQKEQMVKIKEYEAHIEQMKIDQKRVEGEQRRKTMEEEAKNNRYNAEYQDKLARQRYRSRQYYESKVLHNTEVT